MLAGLSSRLLSLPGLLSVVWLPWLSWLLLSVVSSVVVAVASLLVVQVSSELVLVRLSSVVRLDPCVELSASNGSSSGIGVCSLGGAGGVTGDSGVYRGESPGSSSMTSS